MDLLSAVEQFLEFIALSLYVFFWCAVAGVGCWLLSILLRAIRRALDTKYERDAIDRWHKRNQKIANACADLDHPEELQRTLAERYISTLLP